MAITKILARNTRLDAAINYVINGDKTEDHTRHWRMPKPSNRRRNAMKVG